MKIKTLRDIVRWIAAGSGMWGALAFAARPAPEFTLNEDTHVCEDAHGRPGLNPAYLGECGDLRNAKLAGADLRELNLDGANLEGADLTGARLDGAFLNYARLPSANLEGASLVGANVRHTVLDEANLARVDFSRAYLFQASLKKADLRGARLSAFFPSLRVDNNDFRGARFDDGEPLGAYADKAPAYEKALIASNAAEK